MAEMLHPIRQVNSKWWVAVVEIKGVGKAKLKGIRCRRKISRHLRALPRQVWVS